MERAALLDISNIRVKKLEDGPHLCSNISANHKQDGHDLVNEKTDRLAANQSSSIFQRCFTQGRWIQEVKHQISFRNMSGYLSHLVHLFHPSSLMLSGLPNQYKINSEGGYDLDVP